MLDRSDFYQLPPKEKIAKLAAPQWERLTEGLCEMYGFELGTIYSMRSTANLNHVLKEVCGRLFIDINNYGAVDRNPKRAYVVDRMFESVYWNLDMYLTDNQKAELLAAFTGDTVGSWNMWFQSFKPMLYDRSNKLKNFLVYGIKILKTKALYKNFKKRWDYEQAS